MTEFGVEARQRGEERRYLDFVEELGVQQGQLVCDLVAAEVMEGSGPARTNKLFGIFKLDVALIRISGAETRLERSDEV